MNQSTDLYIPDGSPANDAFKKTTHLGVGAHQDDLEFMALHGIIECYDRDDRWFGGVTCTNGSGSARQGQFTHTTDAQMQAIRAEEQREAARVGRYSFMAQLGFSSATIKDRESDALENDLLEILERSRPEIVYTHNLADKHATHIGVTAALIKAIRRMPNSSRPKRLIGCEMWRDLDWLPDDKKVVMDLSSMIELGTKLNGLFVSQIAGGKRYDLAVEGRRRANATLLDSHSTDVLQSVCFGMDMTPLIADDSLDPKAFTLALIEAFKSEVSAEIGKYF